MCVPESIDGSMITNWMAYFITSGALFYTGVLSIFVFVLLRYSRLSGNAVIHSISSVFFLSGVVMVIVSTTPLPVSGVVFFLVSAGFCIIVDSFGKPAWMHRISLLFVLSSTAVLLIVEAPYSFMPRTVVAHDRIYILGDSLTAGLGEKTVTPYPALLRRMTSLDVVDLSIPGSKIKDGLHMAHRIPGDQHTVLIELGGNDWRRGGKNKDFDYSEGFLQLMEYLSSHGHRVIMMEIPFPPFEYRLAYAQRRIARQYGITLIPKRFLSSVLFLTAHGTSDGIHLTQKGHEAMARKLRKMFVVGSDERMEAQSHDCRGNRIQSIMEHLKIISMNIAAVIFHCML